MRQRRKIGGFRISGITPASVEDLYKNQDVTDMLVAVYDRFFVAKKVLRSHMEFDDFRNEFFTVVLTRDVLGRYDEQRLGARGFAGYLWTVAVHLVYEIFRKAHPGTRKDRGNVTVLEQLETEDIPVCHRRTKRSFRHCQHLVYAENLDHGMQVEDGLNAVDDLLSQHKNYHAVKNSKNLYCRILLVDVFRLMRSERSVRDIADELRCSEHDARVMKQRVHDVTRKNLSLAEFV